jgi:hypothetical protein
MTTASRILRGTVIVAALGTISTEFLKSATSTVTSREIGDWYARTRALPTPAARPSSSSCLWNQTLAPEIHWPPSTLAFHPPPVLGPVLPASKPREAIDEIDLIRLLVAGQFLEALAAARANPSLAPLVPGCEAFVRFAKLRDSGDYVSARRVTRELVHRVPRLASVAETWNCRLARMQKSLPDDGWCLAGSSLGNAGSSEFSSSQRSNP